MEHNIIEIVIIMCLIVVYSYLVLKLVAVSRNMTLKQLFKKFL